MKQQAFVLLISAVVLSACSVFGNAELSAARSRWQAANIRHYRYNLRVACFCAFTNKMPMAIEVQDGRVVSIHFNDGTPVSSEDQKMFERYLTIDKLFEFTSESQKDADQIQVVYDATYSFPSSVQIDFIKQAVDDELSLYVSDFQPLH